jgi:hypothetical protein
VPQIVCSGSIASVMREIMRGIKHGFSVDIHKNIVLMMKKCWRVEAEDRPTFSDVLNELQWIKYKIFADAKVREIEEYIDEIQVG